MDRGLVDMFMSTLQWPYLDRMMRGTSSGFSNLVVVGERIKNCLESGKILSVDVVSNGEKPYFGFAKKK